MLDIAPLTIGLVTDTHFWPAAPQTFGEGGRQLQPHSRLLCDLLVQDMRGQALDMAVHLGDITCGGGGYGMPDADVERTLLWLRARLDALDCPVRFLPGNHDAPLGHTCRATEAALGLPPAQGAGVSYPERGWHVEMINAQGHSQEEVDRVLRDEEDPQKDPTFGLAAAVELERLARSLNQARELNVIACCHQLLQPLSKGRTPRGAKMMVRNRQAILDLLAAHGKVRAVFQGHAHIHDRQTLPLGNHACAFVVVPALIQWPVAWLRLVLDNGSLALHWRRLPVDRALVAQSRRALEADRSASPPASRPWRMAFATR